MTSVALNNLDRLVLAAALLGGAAFAGFSATEASLPAYLAGAAGLVAVNERLRAEFPRSVAVVTSLLIFAGTPLFWSMTRTTGFADVASFGLVAALLMLPQRIRIGRAVVWAAAAAVPVGFQYVTLERISGHITSTPVEWTASLFSSSEGLLSLSPVTYVALLGTFAYLWRNRLWAVSALLVLLVWFAMAAFVPHNSDGPTAHGLTAALAMLAPGLAFVIDRARARPLLAIAPLVATALVWNYWLMVQYTVGTLPKDAPMSFATMVRQQAEVHTRSPYLYPFAFPANLWFAWREGVPAERYELLAPEARRQNIDLVLDRQADRFVLEGWEALGQDVGEAVRWIGEQRATIALPLDPVAGRPIRISITARARLEDPAVNAELGLEVNDQEIGRFVVTPATPTELHLTVPAADVGRIFRAGYNRLTFVSYGVHRADVTDQRAPVPFDRAVGVVNRAWPVAVYRIRIAAE